MRPDQAQTALRRVGPVARWLIQPLARFRPSIRRIVHRIGSRRLPRRQSNPLRTGLAGLAPPRYDAADGSAIRQGFFRCLAGRRCPRSRNRSQRGRRKHRPANRRPAGRRSAREPRPRVDRHPQQRVHHSPKGLLHGQPRSGRPEKGRRPASISRSRSAWSAVPRGLAARDSSSRFLMAGELALDGAVRSVRGVLPLGLEARRRGRRALIVPKINAPEASVVDGITVFGVANPARGLRIDQRHLVAPSGAAPAHRRVPRRLNPTTSTSATSKARPESNAPLRSPSRADITS